MSELTLKDLIEFKKDLHSHLVGERRDLNAEHLAIMERAQTRMNALESLLAEAECPQPLCKNGTLHTINLRTADENRTGEWIPIGPCEWCAERNELMEGRDNG